MPLSKNQQQFFGYLRKKKAGEVVTLRDILLHCTGWSPKSFSTYKSKHYIDPFLQVLPNHEYRVLRDGDTISERDIQQAFTQVRPGLLQLVKGTVLRGQVDNYTLISFIGNGQVADVWCARAERGGENVALKVMNPRGDLLDPRFLPNVKDRFIREARNSKKLSHPHIVRYRDSGEFDEHPFLVMDLADTSVSKILESRVMTIKESLTIVESCLKGLAYLHSYTCYHRDVKPLNILLFGGVAVLGDLGIVRWSEMNPMFTSAGTITVNTIRLGSWHYMAPEQRSAPHNVKNHSDVYSLGVSWYEMLTNNVPEPTAVAVGDFEGPCAHEKIDSLIRLMLSYKPADRPSVPELLAVVATLKEEFI